MVIISKLWLGHLSETQNLMVLSIKKNITTHKIILEG